MMRARNTPRASVPHNALHGWPLVTLSDGGVLALDDVRRRFGFDSLADALEPAVQRRLFDAG